MDHLSQAVDTRNTRGAWTGEGAGPVKARKRLATARSPRGDIARAKHRAAGRPSRAPREFVVAALVVLALAGVSTTASTYRAGVAWRDRANTEIIRTQEFAARLSDAQTRLAAATQDLSKAHGQLAAATSQLQRSEGDVIQLERRIQALGTEKARAEDEREAARDDRDRLAKVASLAMRAGQDIDICVSRLSKWLESRPLPFAATQQGQWAAWASSGDSVAAACGNAYVPNDRLKTVLNGNG